MSPIQDHPLRYQLANELHARPFPALEPPCRAAFIAIKQSKDAAARDRDLDRAHLVALLDRYGAPHPQPGATHYFGTLGRYRLKWESHTEFVTYTIFGDGVAERPFDNMTFSMFPDEWLSDAPGDRITSALIRIERLPEDGRFEDKLLDWFVPESLAASRVLEDSAIVASDFRIDTGGHMRIAVFVGPDTGGRRVGRIVQRLAEIETYKTMSMLGLARVRALGPTLGKIDSELTALIGDMTSDESSPEATLKQLLTVSAELEEILATSSFRFGATGAYEAIVTQRIDALREVRIEGRQTFAEFMMRRFDPAMRTVKSTEARMRQLSERAAQAGNLLRTRVDVERQAQNADLLASMDRRADLQLRLQKTVEGLSTVAISYYAVSLLIYLLGPWAEEIGLSKTWLAGIAAPLVIIVVWVMLQRAKKHLE